LSGSAGAVQVDVPKVSQAPVLNHQTGDELG
jgi:hypothetical protein